MEDKFGSLPLIITIISVVSLVLLILSAIGVWVQLKYEISWLLWVNIGLIIIASLGFIIIPIVMYIMTRPKSKIYTSKAKDELRKMSNEFLNRKNESRGVREMRGVRGVNGANETDGYYF